MDPDEVKTRDDLVRLSDLWSRSGNGKARLGENQTAGDYLRGLGDWVRSARGAYANHGEVMPDPPDWRLIAHALVVATVYE